MVIGITGNSGSGKTEFSKVLFNIISSNNLNKKSVEIIDADEVVKKMSEEGSTYYDEIINLFGEDILIKTNNENKLNKQKIADSIFTNKNIKNELDKLTFKYVVQEMKEIINKSNSEVILIDAPLLIESGLNKMCDVVISVKSSKDIRINRITKRDGIEVRKAIQRIEAQEEDNFYIKNSNYVVVNNEQNNLEDDAKYFIDLIQNSNNLLDSEETVVIKNGDIKYLEFKRLLEYENIKHAFTLRPLDLGDNISLKESLKDNNDSNNSKYIKDYNEIKKCLKTADCDLIRPYQNHTLNVKKLGNEKGIFPEELDDVDGLITDKKNKILSLSFADCTPIYLYDNKKQIIGNIHSGWQGTTKKIAKQAIIKMKEEFESNPKDIICVIGPTIRKCHFEVQEDVKNIFYNTFKYMEDINNIIEFNNNTKTYFIDTVEINKNLLKEEGILEENIIDSNICTYCNSKFIHSFRKDNKLSGRNTSLICKV